jgi:hypothetical protein
MLVDKKEEMKLSRQNSSLKKQLLADFVGTRASRVARWFIFKQKKSQFG